MYEKQLIVDKCACSKTGRKQVNQDAEGGRVPEAPALSSKGAAFTIADGISSSDVSDHARRIAITSFLEHYYHTPSNGQSSLQYSMCCWLLEQLTEDHRF